MDKFKKKYMNWITLKRKQYYSQMMVHYHQYNVWNQARTQVGVI